MVNYHEFTSDDELHITSFKSTKIIEIASIIEKLFKKTGYNIQIQQGKEKDPVQRLVKNKPNKYITKWWKPKTTIEDGVEKVFNYMKSTIN